MDEPGRGVSPPLAAFFATAGFGALGVFGFGFTSLLGEQDVIATPGLGQGPGIVAMLLSVVVFALTIWTAVRGGRYASAFWVAVATAAAYPAGIAVGAVFQGVDPAKAAGAAGGFALSWFMVVLLAAAGVAAWCGVALVRTRSSRPQWPWEKDDDED